MDAVRQPVKCSYCMNDLIRVVWNYGRNRPMTEFFCDNVCKGNWQKAQREALGFTREWLYQKYVIESLGCPDIAKLAGRDSKRVLEWIRDYGIPTRPRGSNVSNQFQKGQRSAFAGKHHTEENRAKIRARRLADGHVPYLKNGVHHLKGKRGADTPGWKGGITPERQVFYATPEWKAAVRAVWIRDDAKCQRCGRDHRLIDRKAEKFHVHHIQSFAIKELRCELNNLVLLCQNCHRWIHSRKNVSRLYLALTA